jgi:hypothetical protein
LVNNTDSGRNDLESLESLLAPLEEFVALAIPLEFEVEVLLERVGGAGEVDLDGVIDNEIDGNKRFDELGAFVHSFNRTTHGGEVHQKGDSGKILKDDPGDNERNFFGSRSLGIPIDEIFDVLLGDTLSIAVAEKGFEDDTDRNRELGDFTYS